jgi:hypothetical protein
MQSFSIKKFYNEEIAISRKTEYDDNYGGVKTEWEEVYENIRCRIYDVTGNFEVTFEGTRQPVEARMLCNKETDIKKGDRIKLESDNEEYLVIQVKKMWKQKTVSHKECYLARE